MKSKTVFYGIRWTLMTTFIRRIISLLMFFFVAQWLTKADFGVFRTYNLILLIATFVVVPGLDSHYLTDKNRPLLNLYSLIQASSLLSLLGVIALTLFGNQIGILYQSHLIGIVLTSCGFLLIVEALRKILRTMAQKRLMFRELAIAETLNVLLYCGLAIVLIYFYRHVWIYILLFYLGNVLESLYLAFQLRNDTFLLRSLRAPFRRVPYVWANIRRNFRFISNVSLVNLIGTYSGNAPILFLGALAAPEYMGLYFFAGQLIGIPVGMLTGSISQVFYPVFAATDSENISQGIKRYINLVLALGLPFLILFGIALQFFVPMIFGSKWNDSLPLIYYLLILYGTSLLHHPLSGIPNICRKPQWELIWNVVTLGLRMFALLIGMQSGFREAVLYFCIVSGIMHIGFYYMALWLLKVELVDGTMHLLKGSIPSVALLLLIVLSPDHQSLIWSTLVFCMLYPAYLIIWQKDTLADLLRALKGSYAK